MKQKVKHGFTLVEVGLFLAVTGILFVGIVMGVQGSMQQQRNNDAVQGFAEFLRTVYSQTSNVEGYRAAGGGATEKAIYGKLITFGEKYNLEGNENKDGAIFSYTIIGDADGNIESGDVLDALASVKANVFRQEGDDYTAFAGIAEQYIPRWEAKIQTTKEAPYVDFKGAILIVRHPNSGTVFTYVYRDNNAPTIEINEIRRTPHTSLPGPLSDERLKKFRIEDADFCVNTRPERTSEVRRDIRIVAGARNSSGVEVIAQDDDSGVGNRCK